MELHARCWDLNGTLLSAQGFDDDSIRVHASVELSEDLQRIDSLVERGELSFSRAMDMKLLCEERNRVHWGSHAAS